MLPRALARLLVVLVVALPVTACTSDDAEPDGRPAASASAPDPVDPVVFDSSGWSCVGFTGRTVIWEEAHVKRGLTLHDFSPVGLVGGFHVRRTTIAPVPQGVVPFTGSIKGRAPARRYWDRIGWRQRTPLAGASVSPGSYYVYVEARITGPAHYDAFRLTWTDTAGATGSSLWRVRDHYRPHCKHA